MFYRCTSDLATKLITLIYFVLNEAGEFRENFRISCPFVNTAPFTNGRVLVEVLSEDTVQIQTTSGRNATITVPNISFSGKVVFLNRHFVVWAESRKCAVFDIRTFEYVIHSRLLIYDADHYYVPRPHLTSQWWSIRRFDGAELQIPQVNHGPEMNSVFANTGIGITNMTAQFIDTSIAAVIGQQYQKNPLQFSTHILEHDGSFYRFTEGAVTGAAVIPDGLSGWVAIDGLSSYDGHEDTMLTVDVPLETV